MPRPSPASNSPGHGARAHARFSPSASERWLACPHSIPFTEALVAAGTIADPELDRGGEAAQRGTRAHEVAERALRLGLAHQEFEVMEQWTHTQVSNYISVVQSLNDDLDLIGVPAEERTVMIEARVSLSADVWGSIDYALVCVSQRELWVIDLKTGHRMVPAQENTQLMTYAAAIAKRAGWEIDRANLWIAQADAPDPVSKWTISVEDLKIHARRCNAAVRDAQRYDPRAPRFSNGDHCGYCPAKAHCPAQRSLALDAFGDAVLVLEGSNPPVAMPDPSTLSPELVAKILTNEPQLRAWLDSVREHVLSQRPVIPGFKVVAARSRTTWANDEETVATFFQANHPHLMRTQLPTISAARAALSAEAFANLTTTPPGSPTIAPESDPRPALPLPGAVFADGANAPA